MRLGLGPSNFLGGLGLTTLGLGTGAWTSAGATGLACGLGLGLGPAVSGAVPLSKAGMLCWIKF